MFMTLVPATLAQEFNAGFVEGLWYDDEYVFADQPTRMYVAVRNNTGADLTGTVEFFVDDKRIERNNVSAINGRIIESWADWTPRYGEHTIRATLSRIELHKVGSGTEAITVTSALAEDTIFVDYDTDGDTIANSEDNDDDGDGMSDEEEKKAGTDPLDANDPPPKTTDDTKNTEDETASNTEGSPDGGSSGHPNDEPEGLEQYLTASPADTALTTFTQTVNSTKKRIDAYRTSRNTSLANETDIEEAREETNESPSTSSVASSTLKSSKTDENDDGFGEVTRTHTKNGSGLVSSIIKAIGHLFSNLYTLILFLISLYLSNPVVVQLTLLLLILFLIIKVAKRLGQRPQ